MVYEDLPIKHGGSFHGKLLVITRSSTYPLGMSKRITTGFHENPQRGSVVATGFVQSNEKGDVISVISMSLWVYGYQRSHYLTYSGYIYIYIYILDFFVSSEIRQFSGSLRVFAKDL